MLKQSGNAIVWSYDGETLRAEPWGDASVRVRAVKMGKIEQAPGWALLPSENTEIDITETEYEGLKAPLLKKRKNQRDRTRKRARDDFRPKREEAFAGICARPYGARHGFQCFDDLGTRVYAEPRRRVCAEGAF